MGFDVLFSRVVGKSGNTGFEFLVGVSVGSSGRGGFGLDDGGLGLRFSGGFVF